MPETVIRGTIRILGLIHGGAAVNTIVTLYETPSEFEFKQFVSEEQLQDYAQQEMLAIQRQESA
jgi:hypothetical protein